LDFVNHTKIKAMKDWKALYEKVENANALTALFFSDTARENLKDFLDMFRKDQSEKLDWDKGYEILDDEIGDYLPEYHLNKKDAFNLFVKAYLKTGEPCRFLINTIIDLEQGQIKVGIADVPDEVEIDDDEEDDDDEDLSDAEMERMALAFIENMRDKIKSGGIKRLDDSPNCSRCGRSDLPLTITFNSATFESQKICSVCMHNSGASGKSKRKVDVKKLDKEIAELEDLSKKYEELIKKQPEPDDLPPELARYAITPMSSYKSIQAMLADLRSQRMAAMTSMEDETRLNYELKKAVASEDYKKSAQLRDKLKKIKKK
jgi:hypothetical protein